MKKIRLIYFVTGICLLSFVSCNGRFGGYKFDRGEISDIPVNFMEINTEYDDYNATAPSFGDVFPLFFSSSRNSKGKYFDIVYKLIDVNFSRTSGKLSVYTNKSSSSDVFIENLSLHKALEKINSSSSDELGPYLIPQGRIKGGTGFNGRYETYCCLYSTNKDGNQDILFTNNLENEEFELPQRVEFLNSEFDDAYPCFNKDFSELYFCSNREKKFDIYAVKTDPSKRVLDILSDANALKPEKVLSLSSDYEDKCPYIVGDLMVLASNRPGGFGGYDLYYSKYEKGEWTKPINMGDKVNTEHDEYRPVVKELRDFNRDFMIFSSNRPGGKGGFDLYYVGIPKF